MRSSSDGRPQTSTSGNPARSSSPNRAGRHPTTARTGLGVSPRKASAASKTARTDSSTAGLMKAHVLIKTRLASSGVSTAVVRNGNAPRSCSVSTRFFGQPRLMVCTLYVVGMFLPLLRTRWPGATMTPREDQNSRLRPVRRAW